MNVKLLEEVKKRIRQEPTHFNMHDWWTNIPNLPNDCGTAGCIAGWCCIVGYKGKEKTLRGIINDLETNHHATAEEEAIEKLEVDPFDARKLFHTTCWPEPFRTQYDHAQRGCKTTGGRDFARQADIACRRIDHFIKEGE